MIISCKKTDFRHTDLKADLERFFRLPQDAPASLHRIVENMKMQDGQKPFVNSFAIYQGYPIWEHAKITIKGPQYNSVGPENDTLVSVPIVEDGTNYIKSVLAIKVNSEVWYKLLEGIKYRELPPEDPNDPGQPFTIIDFLKLMMELEVQMFGYNEFEIVDEEIINQRPSVYTGGGGNPGINYGTQLIFSGGCTTFNWGYYSWWNNEFIITASDEACLYETGELVYSLNVPLFETGGGGDEGGSTSSEECRRGFVRIRGFDGNGNPLTPCTVIADTTSYPCATAFQAGQKMKNILREDKVDSALNSIPNLATEPLEKGFPVFQRFEVDRFDPLDTTFGSFIVGSMFTGTDSNIVMNYNIPYLSVEVAVLHTHPRSGYPGPSAADVYGLITSRLDNNNFVGTFTIAANGSQFALTVTDYDKARDFYNTKDQYLDGEKWKEGSEAGKVFKDAFKYFQEKYKGDTNQDKLAYEMAMATVLNEFNSGVTLHKKDSNGNFKPLVIKTTTPNPNKPRKKVYTQDCQ